jgi:hypothetical protein
MLTVKCFARKISSATEAIIVAKKLNMELIIHQSDWSIVCRDGKYILPSISERHRRRLINYWNDTMDLETKHTFNYIRKNQKEFKKGVCTFRNFNGNMNFVMEKSGMSCEQFLQFLKTNYNDAFTKIETVK